MTDYYNPHHILADETVVPVRFLSSVTGLGRALDPSCHDLDLPADTTVELPVWLALPLAKRGMVELKTPGTYGEKFRRRMNAGAECIRLKGRAPYFYEVGKKCNDILQDVEVSNFLVRTFKTRYHELLSKSLNSLSGHEVLQLQAKLSTEEFCLFEAGRISVSETENWSKNIPRPAWSAGASTRRKREGVQGDSEVTSPIRKR